MGKVVAAVGMILLALEDQLALKQTAQDRERRARKELEAYTKVVLSRRRVEDFDRQANLICQTVVANSRFSQAGLMLLQAFRPIPPGGAAGFDDAALNALESLLPRGSPAAGFLARARCSPAAANTASPSRSASSHGCCPATISSGLHLTELVATPLYGRSATDGALLLVGIAATPKSPLRAEDLLPVEVLAARIQAARSQTMMLEKLIDAEKFAGLGQLANNVTRQLNNPLTVILGYASLLEATRSMNRRRSAKASRPS